MTESTQAAAEFVPQLLTIEKAARYAGLGRHAVRAKIRSGEWVCLYQGVKQLVPKVEIDRWIEARIAEARSAQDG